MNGYTTLDEVVNTALEKNKIRMHPNGFYQLDLAPNFRLHVWPREVRERQKNFNQVHDHTFSFRSLILLGSLTHIEYEFVEDRNGNKQLYEITPTDRVNTRMNPTGIYGKLHVSKKRILEPGDIYYFRSKLFHETYNDQGILTATIMHKVASDPNSMARVVGVRNYDEDDNSFKREEINLDLASEEIGQVMISVKEDVKLKAFHFVDSK